VSPQETNMERNVDVATMTQLALATKNDYSTFECLNRFICGIYMYYSLLWKWPQHFAGPKAFAPPFMPIRVRSWPFIFRFFYMHVAPGWWAIKCFQHILAGKDSLGVEKAQGKFGNAAGGLINLVLHRLYVDLTLALTWAIAGLGVDVEWLWFSKDVWRGVLEGAGCTVPPCIGRWNPKKQAVDWALPLRNTDLIGKASAAALGLGDFKLQHGVDFNSKEEAEEKVNEHITKAAVETARFAKDRYLLLERMQPDPTLGVHCFEILTMHKGDGRVITARVSLFTGSHTWTSHDAMTIFLVDPLTEKIVGRDTWHKIREGWPVPGQDMLGRKISGVSAMCEQAEKAHGVMLVASKTNPRLTALKAQNEHFRVIGWDAMMTEDGKTVWFEGNVPTWRLSKFLCSSWSMMFQIRDMLSFTCDAA